MTKAELIEALKDLPDQCEVLVDIKRWDEPLNLTPVTEVRVYGMDGDASDREAEEKAGGEAPFATLLPDTSGATRLDPNGDI